MYLIKNEVVNTNTKLTNEHILKNLVAKLKKNKCKKNEEKETLFRDKKIANIVK